MISVGSFEHHRCEVDAELIRRAGAVVDEVDTSVTHAGPIAQALERSDLKRAELRELGAVLLGAEPGRTSADEIIFYNSVGLGVQDAAAAHAVPRHPLSSR